MDYIIIKETNKPETFSVVFDWVAFYQQFRKIYYSKSKEVSYNQVLAFAKRNAQIGLKPLIKKRYTYQSAYYITFRSKHDAMAFKLRWL